MDLPRGAVEMELKWSSRNTWSAYDLNFRVANGQHLLCWLHFYVWRNWILFGLAG